MSSFADLLCRMRSGERVAVLAPMAGITDLGMRKAAQQFGADAVVSEMVDSRFLADGASPGAARARGDGLSGHVVQVAGCDPARLADAARLAVGAGAEAVDINMGCPAKKVVGGLSGSALMRDLDVAVRLIRAVRAAVPVPVTVKMRLGWDDTSRNAPELARRAEAEGVAFVSVHGRTRNQFYDGRADWAAIRAVSEAVEIPVIANGDCAGLADARTMLRLSGAAGVMIGRAAIGRPWLVGDVSHALTHGCERPGIAMASRLECALAHFAGILGELGTSRGVRHARKHLAGYATHAGHPPGTALHGRIVTEECPTRIVRLITEVFDGGAREIAA